MSSNQLAEAMAKCLEIQIEALKEQVKIYRGLGSTHENEESEHKKKKMKKEVDPNKPK